LKKLQVGFLGSSDMLFLMLQANYVEKKSASSEFIP